MSFQIVEEPGGFFTIKGVPIFETHSDRGFMCDEQWLKDAIANQIALKSEGYRPTVIIGHNQKGQEKEAYGFLDNLALKGKRLYADLVRIPKELKEKIIKNAYPNRSLEILPSSKRILCMALLGGTTPHFSLPQMVYENEEKSEWVNGMNLTFNGSYEMDDKLKKEIVDTVKAAVPEAMKAYSAQIQQEGEPQIYNLNTQEATQIFEGGDVPEIYKAENGQLYSVDDKGIVYVWPSWVANMYGIGSMASKALHTIKEIPGRARVFAGKTVPNLAKRGANAYVEGVGKAADWAVNNPKKALTAAGVGLAAAGTGEYLVGRHRGKQGKKAGFTGAYLGGPLYVAGNRQGQIAAGYALDTKTGILYYEGQAVGQVNPLAEQDEPEGIPEIEGGESPQLRTDPGPEGGAPDSPPENNVMVQEGVVDESAAGYALQEHDQEIYELQRKVDHLTTANELLQVSKRAEAYQKYLLDLKKAGAPVGNIQDQVDYMMSLDKPEQVAKYKQHLESLPKLSLDSTNYENTGSSDKDLDEDFSRNAKTYELLGVTRDDLKYAKYLRTAGDNGQV